MEGSLNILVIGFIGFGLAMDAFAVSIANGLAVKVLRIRHAVRIAIFYGTFQAVMPVLGWLAGYGLREIICEIDHWIAFGLLAFIGSKMIYESYRLEIPDQPCNPLTVYRLLILSFATSIDALAVGLSLSILQAEIVTPALIIGAITFILALTGVFIGNRFGHFFEKKIELVGGLILFGIGIKILIDHLSGQA